MSNRNHHTHYHVIARCNAGERHLAKEDDCRVLLERLRYYKNIHKCKVFQFTIIPSHLHLMVAPTGGGTLDQFMHDFCLTFARYFNRKYDRKGHFWRHNYRRRVIHDDFHALACLRYQDNNAQAAGLVKHPRDWPWNGYRYYAEGASSEILTPHPSYELLGSNNMERRAAYRAMFENMGMKSDLERMFFEGRIREGSRRFNESLRRITSPVKKILTTTKWLPTGN